MDLHVAREIGLVVAAAVAGSVASSLLACVPGLHVYNVLGLIFIGFHMMAGHGVAVPTEVAFPLIAGMMVGYAMLNTVPSVLLAAPDESALFTVLPGQKYFMAGKGYEGTLVTAAGGLAGLFVVVLLIGPLAPRFLSAARLVFQPHIHWIVWCVITFMIMSEWPKGGLSGQGGWSKFVEGWKTTSAGLLTFLLSGLLGFTLMFRSPIPAEVAFQSLLPAFVGLFTLPWLLINIVSRVEVPPQTYRLSAVSGASVARGAFAGGLGGGFAAFFPAITGGVGGLLAGHATALRDDRAFLISQGASKVVYYVGAFLLCFVPTAHVTRGGGAWMLRGMFTPMGYHDYYMVLAALALSGAVSFLLIGPLARATIALVTRFGYQRLSLLSLAVIVALVAAITGIMGLGVMLVATGIGLIPVLFGSRRMNCLGVILLPLACNMSGVGGAVAAWLGLL